jgi:hypothetical protein
VSCDMSEFSWAGCCLSAAYGLHRLTAQIGGVNFTVLQDVAGRVVCGSVVKGASAAASWLTSVCSSGVVNILGSGCCALRR